MKLWYVDKEIKQVKNPKYLGMTIDTNNKMNGAANIDNVCCRQEKTCIHEENGRSTFTKKMAGADWGASTEVLATTYKNYVRPLLELDVRMGIA
jgi:hypothetical protein